MSAVLKMSVLQRCLSVNINIQFTFYLNEVILCKKRSAQVQHYNVIAFIVPELLPHFRLIQSLEMPQNTNANWAVVIHGFYMPHWHERQMTNVF